jgi:putative oxidoreductase
VFLKGIHAKKKLEGNMYRNATLHRLATMYGWVISLGSNLQSLFLLWMRITWGHQFVLTGLKKLTNIDETIHFFTSLNIANAQFHAYLVGYTELICGGLLILGLASRLAAIPLVIIMITALTTAHAAVFSHFHFITDPSSLVSEAPYPFLITTLMILIFGPGRISVDAWIKRWVKKQPTY